MCGVCLHSFCVAEANREIEAAGAEVIEGDNLCSVSCYRFRKADALTPEVVKAERTLLMKKNKEQLKKEGRELNIKVNCHVNGASRDAPKEVIVARLLEKKMLALCPSLEVAQEVIATPSRVTVHDKFRLINIIFSDELGDMAMHSKESATRAELDAGVVGHKSPFWQLVESRFNNGFLPDGTDGQAYADLIHHIHPLFHTGDEAINPSLHGAFQAENLRSLWKEIQSEYDTVVTKFTKSGNHQSSFTKAAMRALNNNNNNNSDELSTSTLNDDDEVGDDDEFGVETGGWCCFTNSLPIVYLRMWLNERPLLTSFVSRKIPDGIQLDTARAASTKKRLASVHDPTT
jgi:hypothetical protein